jgi:CheY-like chemotaxis protein
MGKHILVIEDEALIAADMLEAMQAAGAVQVEYAATEAEALAAIGQKRWDAALADANLSGRGIDQVAAALREHGIPFIIVTGYGRNNLSSDLADIPLIEKPCAGRQLVKAVSLLCAR